ncbi:23S rRNA (uracil(1939)-C(5))-methyltransferase RlmD [Selenomonas sp. TAMA-11512]|uniref:23S rRNA (uracil(1939)-C(5))-methyltransferase RlmD n=1 Tax=Selenomonas sp. TAMA-11512 TaxID=3095337 RepID=UPI003088D038|nr:23S rRNA (uracil(1939)-C(5))-methyltransferase RlmD [Selenomonas sp. TAMA-11512]
MKAAREGAVVEVQIASIGAGGEGVGRLSDGLTVFVPESLPEERLKVRLTTVKKSYAVGVPVERLNDSPLRTDPVCPIYPACGGCQLQHLSYAGQLEAKRQQVIDALERIGHLKGLTVHPTLAAVSPWRYRNKVQFPVAKGKGKVLIGCYAKGSHDIIDTNVCHIQKEENDVVVKAARDVVERLRIPPYDEDRHIGVLRHIMGRVGARGDVMVVLVTASKELAREKEIVKLLRAKIPRLVSVQQNIQTYRNNVILGRDTKLLWGKNTILDSIGKLSFHVSARSFFQVNSEQAERLYQKAMDYADLTGRETVIDAYCGTGTISLFLAQRARKVYGIEIVKPSIVDAQKNARDNNIKNVEFIVGDATKVIPRLYREGVRADVVVVDPPRAGCTETVLRTVADMQPQRMVYVSCNPASLARDLAILTELGYKTQEVQPVDMFPQTSHVEVCTKLVKAD